MNEWVKWLKRARGRTGRAWNGRPSTSVDTLEGISATKGATPPEVSYVYQLRYACWSSFSEYMWRGNCKLWHNCERILVNNCDREEVVSSYSTLKRSVLCEEEQGCLFLVSLQLFVIQTQHSREFSTQPFTLTEESSLKENPSLYWTLQPRNINPTIERRRQSPVSCSTKLKVHSHLHFV